MHLSKKTQGILYGSLFLFLAVNLLAAQDFIFSKSARLLQEKVLRGEPIAADLVRLKTAEPNNLVADYLQAQSLFFEQFLRMQPGKEKLALERLGGHLDALEDAPKGPWHDLVLAEVHLMRAMLRGREKSYLGAAWDLYKSHDYLHHNKKVYPKFEPNNAVYGMVEALLGSIPDDYRFYAELVGMDGSLGKGLAEMKQAVAALANPKHANHFLYHRSAMLYAMARFHLLDDREASLLNFGIPVTESPLYTYAEVSLLQQSRKMEQVQRLILDYQKGKGKMDFPYLDFILARTYLTENRELAIAAFKQFLKKNTGTSNIKATHRYLYWLYALEGKWENAEIHKKAVLYQGEKKEGADKQAVEDVQKPFNRHLIESQLFFDNGQYAKGIAILLACTKLKSTWSQEDQRSYHYRLGRLYGETGQFELAKFNYTRAVNLLASSSFEKGNSLLQLGILEEKQGHKEEAFAWYQRCLKEKGFPYEDGIHFKAKTGIKRLKK